MNKSKLNIDTKSELESNVIIDLSDPRLTEEQRKTLYQIGERLYGTSGHTFDELPVRSVVEVDVRISEMAKRVREDMQQRIVEGEKRADIILKALLGDKTIYGRELVIQNNVVDVYTLVSIVNKALKMNASEQGKLAANILHSRPGGSREKQEKIRQIWATGKFSSRDKCAIQECDALGMSYEAARRALRNTPDPT